MLGSKFWMVKRFILIFFDVLFESRASKMHLILRFPWKFVRCETAEQCDKTCLFSVYGAKLYYSYYPGIIIHQYKDPYQPSSTTESKARIFVVAQLSIPKLRRWTSRATSTDGSRSPCASGRPAWDVTALGKAWETRWKLSNCRKTGWIRDWVI